MGLTDLTNIPKIMRVNGWLDGAVLMEKWFTGPATAMPAYTSPDLSTIRMDKWALTFPRAKTVFDGMVADKLWSSEKAKRDVWPGLVHKLGFSRGGLSFDLSLKTVQEQHELHVNHKPVETGLSFHLDDMVAALGNFSIYVAPLAGEIAPEGSRVRVKLTSVGFHIMDSYDFEGSQSLGYWDEATNTASAIYMWSGTSVGNDTFRDWRDKHKMGGDFKVFSDVKTVTLNPPDSFLV